MENGNKRLHDDDDDGNNDIIIIIIIVVVVVVVVVVVEGVAVDFDLSKTNNNEKDINTN